MAIKRVNALRQYACSFIGILIFYGFSIALTFYNSILFSLYPFPLTITLIHTLIKFFAAHSFHVFYYYSKRAARTVLPWPVFVKVISIAGITAALDIGLSNSSLEYITVSLYTMTKSTAIIFIAFFGVVFRVEQLRLNLLLVAALIAVGLFLFTYESSQFNLYGFLLVLIASAISGIRWSISQLILQRSKYGLSHPADMIFHMQPWMSATLVPFTLYFEGLLFVTCPNLFHPSSAIIQSTAWFQLLFGAFLALGLELSEMYIVSRASSLTLSVASILKEICSIFLASTFNGDRLSITNYVGFAICIVGVSLHVRDRLKLSEKTRNNSTDETQEMHSRERGHGASDTAQLLASD